MKAPERIDTTRLVLRRPSAADAESIFARHAGDREVARLMGWPEHRPSARVLEKCGCRCEGTLGRYMAFPNLGTAPVDVLCYARTW